MDISEREREQAGETEEGTGAEQGMSEDSGLRDKAAREGEDTAAALQDTSAAKRPDR